MLQRDKNHPAIIMWSCGNESGGGETLYEMSNLLGKWDPTRPIHYEGVSLDPRYPDTTDIRSTMYWPADRVESYLQSHSDKPCIQVEYAHAMGNSCGSLERYIRLEEQYPQYQGGFIWDWIDQQLEKDGFLHYGGDFRERPSYAENGKITYEGFGPDESAPDRLSGARRGQWNFNAADAITPYMTPQACVLRCQTHWFTCGGL